MSKTQAEKIPPSTDPFVLDSDTLYEYLTTEVPSESGDHHPRDKPTLSIPRPMTQFSKLYEQATPEEKYHSSMRLLKGNDDPSLQKHLEKVHINHFLCDEDPQTEYHTFMIK